MGAKIQLYPKNLGTGGSSVDLGGLPIISRWPPLGFYGTDGLPTTWVVYPWKAASCRPNFMHSYHKSSGPAISLRVPSELPDLFGESPSELPMRSHLIVRTWLDA
ncbi:hypothetical protein B296_00006147 [Ensete ventricosum]|uniref:Uncharacterized protein n=1 Tax=Ensete ventricosum TaxID=4639 RepID=A0A427AT53_ENSVE|nr:hypothetical protein B296_00006147 [Ensete ventricosum]